MNKCLLPILLLLYLCIPASGQTTDDAVAIKKTLESWNQGWAQRNAELAIKDYAKDVDWTNAFGDRFQGRDELKKGLQFIFGLDFVMAGSSGKNEFEDVTSLSPDIALLRSKLIRKGQKTAQGKLLPDRHINHLRVLRRTNGQWKIVSHMISQAQPKTLPKDKRKPNR